MFIKCTCFNSYFKSVVNKQKQQKISKKQQEQEYKYIYLENSQERCRWKLTWRVLKNVRIPGVLQNSREKEEHVWRRWDESNLGLFKNIKGSTVAGNRKKVAQGELNPRSDKDRIKMDLWDLEKYWCIILSAKRSDFRE